MVPIQAIRVLSLAIMAAAAAVSYSTQRTLFLAWQVDTFTASVAPIAVDLLAILCSIALHADDVAPAGRRTAIVVLVVTGAASTAANYVAGHTPGSKIVHGAMVVLYLLAEFVASTVKKAPPAADPKRSEAARKAAATRKANAARRTRRPRAPKPATTVAELEAVYAAESAPVSPAS